MHPLRLVVCGLLISAVFTGLELDRARPPEPATALGQITHSYSVTTTFTSKEVQVGYTVFETITHTATLTMPELLTQDFWKGPHLKIEGHWKVKKDLPSNMSRATVVLTIVNLMDMPVLGGEVHFYASYPEYRALSFPFGSIRPRGSLDLTSAILFDPGASQSDNSVTEMYFDYVSMIVGKTVETHTTLRLPRASSSKGTTTYLATYTTTFVTSEILFTATPTDVILIIVLVAISVGGILLFIRSRRSPVSSPRD